MKNYNIESNGYSTILTLLTVRKDMRNMTEEEFIQFMKEAFAEAQAEYSEIMAEANTRLEKKIRENNEKAVWKKYAEKLASYKRESARQKKIAEIQKEIDNFKFRPNSDDIFFDVMSVLNLGGCMHSYACLTKSTTDDHLRMMYSDYEEFIKMSNGVVFKYHLIGTDPISHYGFRPWVEFIIPENVMEDLKKKKEDSDRRVAEFYDSLKYKGD